MRKNDAQKLSRKIVNEIVRDFTDRRGLRQSWEEIDDDIQRKIKAAWREIVVRTLTNKDLLG